MHTRYARREWADGRRLKGPNDGDIFDHFYIEYEYADGTKLNSQIRHISGTWNKGGATFQGATGSASLQAGIKGAQW
jgi:myo-inositol 2-dehydrogenase/D-chiro-inositol 1-dehydrogenase